jgi:DNA-binding transcriptional ArsR family regulator
MRSGEVEVARCPLPLSNIAKRLYGTIITVVASPTREIDTTAVLRALASPRRLQILQWLRDPVAHFPPQRDGDLVKDGVCVIFIADKLGVAQPTATAHLQELARAGLVTPKRLGQWTFYKRDEAAIRVFKRQLGNEL